IGHGRWHRQHVITGSSRAIHSLRANDRTLRPARRRVIRPEVEFYQANGLQPATTRLRPGFRALSRVPRRDRVGPAALHWRRSAMDLKDGLPISTFASAEDWERWLVEHHLSCRGLWLQIARKGAGVPTVTYAQALDVALC